MKNIFISDMDGTLLKNDATLSDFSRNALIRMINEGLNFTVASARSVVSIQMILKDIPFRLPVIEFNGAFISDFQTGRHNIINDISKNVKEDIFKYIQEYSCTPFISSYNGKEDCLYYDYIGNDGMDWYVNDRKRSKDKRLRKSVLSDVLQENVVCFTIIDKQENLIDLASFLNENYSQHIEIHLMENQYSPGWYWLTIHDSKATKDQAIKMLLSEYGFTPEDLTVFGDNANDIKMFKLAKNKIAVENAKLELKKCATEVIGTNEDDSVVKYILRNTGKLYV